MKNSELPSLVKKAHDLVEKVRNDPKGRYRLRVEFYRKYGFSRLRRRPGYGQSELAFLRWEIRRGVLNPFDHPRQPGSPWWRAVNEEYLYLAELARLVHEAGLPETEVAGPAKFWLAYFRSPSSISWYRAHNACIVQGYLNQIEQAKRENHEEQVFMNIVLYRLLYAQAMVEEDPIALGELGQILADPRLHAVNLIVRLPDFYPNYYPLTQEDTNHILRRHALEDRFVEFTDDLFIICHLSKLYHLAAGWLGIPQLQYFIDDKKYIYPTLPESLCG